MLLHIRWRMKHGDATDFDVSIYQLTADLILGEFIIYHSHMHRFIAIKDT